MYCKSLLLTYLSPFNYYIFSVILLIVISLFITSFYLSLSYLLYSFFNKFLVFRDLTLIELKSFIILIFNLKDRHHLNIKNANPIFYDHFTITFVVYVFIKLFYNAYNRYNFFSNLNIKKDVI